MKIIKKILLALLAIFIAMQFYRPEKNVDESEHTSIFLADTDPSPQVRAILKETCYDCHSNNTIYPWYNHIAPVSYWLADHIEHAQGHLNFSEWDNYTAKKKDHKLEEVIEMIEEGEMPLKEYTWTHEAARLTDAQRQEVIDWAKSTRTLYQLSRQPE